MKNCVYWSAWWVNLAPKDTVKEVKHLKYSILFNNPPKEKNTAAETSTQKNSDFKIHNQKSTLLILVSKYAKSAPGQVPVHYFDTTCWIAFHNLQL